jgi:hypothetical protein
MGSSLSGQTDRTQRAADEPEYDLLRIKSRIFELERRGLSHYQRVEGGSKVTSKSDTTFTKNYKSSVERIPYLLPYLHAEISHTPFQPSR